MVQSREIIPLWRRRLMRQRVAPLLHKLAAIDGLVALHSGSDVCARRGSFEMHNNTLRLVVNAIAPCTQGEAIIRIFVVSRLETRVKPAELEKQGARRCQQRSRTIVDFAEKAVQRRIRCLVVFPKIVPGPV